MNDSEKIDALIERLEIEKITLDVIKSQISDLDARLGELAQLVRAADS